MTNDETPNDEEGREWWSGGTVVNLGGSTTVPGERPTSAAAVTVIYVAGLPHCGSTVFGKTLEKLEGVTCVGEAISVRGNGGTTGRNVCEAICSCGQRVKDCSFWYRVDRELAQRGLSLRALDLSHHDDAIFVQHNEAFFASIARVSGAKVIVDASKGSARLTRLSKMAPDLSFPIMVVHLTRSLKGYLASNKKRYDIGCREMVLLSLRYVSSMRTMRQLARSHKEFPIRFEEFVAQPHLFAASITDAVGWKADASMIDLPYEDHHDLGGNRIRNAPEPLEQTRAEDGENQFSWRQARLAQALNWLGERFRP